MIIRKEIEAREKRYFSPSAALSVKTRGRRKPEKECEFRTAFQRDRDKIIHCKSFRRLKHKTQVFLSPVEDHYRTRLTHTLEVAQIARTIARALCLNEDLTEAIALAHDLGHTPFGHAGEYILDDILKENYGRRFFHNEQSVRIVEELEKDGQGLNLCHEIIDGIRNHTPDDPWPETLEGCLVRLADRIAYLHHDIEDALRAGVLKKRYLPRHHMKVLNNNILDTIISDIIKQSRGKSEIKLSRAVQKAMDGLYNFMYKNVYINPTAKKEESKVPVLMRQLFRHYHYNADFQNGAKTNEDQVQHTVDFISGMTDRYAITKFQQLFVPDEWHALPSPAHPCLPAGRRQARRINDPQRNN
ncbi:deoxyguanosinetriphosphate triphosphohydrolase [candidate division WOR-1 bacterium RIFCSPLOWO2_02_FULL_46_20]|uniref:Deoxyguanosinetriphosphate triphosphohydrolase n=2 Tax=Saganbacteria TaxID=1703751 RepID=A0A1F4RH44_UNCSA|nr:MAG: deoxyguanosinetriphosphate triphosphohydrolase [candidate division WOR-1 bacterium RIFCSPHIGHO2_02_FULL_45_12]OGC07491.1 MAG: deoxyguanosinetriphosphate triphosphohydrolase [candidate division WOR-1 bacterium RIFCSPLOWO2_02_FULL_46_20]OGC09791.1 MAG: deoxyguanosinetriphosphate triphosphohydrolase [candidate division WOR-1 bacterium RIFCSPLOWO2_12_FULL_45_9]